MSDPTTHNPQPTPPKVKICGTTSVHDAVLAAEAGADAVGFIFAPISKRLVTAQVARAASLAVGPAVARVGVFLNQGLDEVLRLAEASRMSAVQLHGPVSDEFVRTVAAFYPVLRVVNPADLVADLALPSSVTLMVDAPQPGGGVPLDWEGLRPVFPAGAWLAAGLGPENVAQAIHTLRPAAVDAVSKLESRPGVKDPDLVRAFVGAARESHSSYPQ